MIFVKNQIELCKYLKKNLLSNEIIIGMGAGIISRWMTELKNFTMNSDIDFKKNLETT